MNIYKENFKRKSNRLKLAWLSGWSEGSAIVSNSPDFELEHMRNVVFFISKIAKERDLNMDVALYSAYLHDSGRYYLNFNGKKHGEKGADLAKNILKKLNVNKKIIGKVQATIKNHSKKEKIHDKYSEALKDADSMAHLKEGMDLSDRPFELFRAENALIPPAELFLISETDFSQVLRNSWLNLKNKLMKLSEKDKKSDSDYFKDISNSLEPFETEDSREIKELRISLRKMRTILGLLKKKVKGIEITGIEKKIMWIEKILKLTFLNLEKTRKISVVKKYVKKFEAYEMVKDIIEHEDVYLREMAIDNLKKEFDLDAFAEIDETVESISVALSGLKISPYKFLIKYKKIFIAAINYSKAEQKKQKKKSKNLHQLRIIGKKLKYFIEDGIFEFVNDKDYTLLLRLHDTLGDLNDIKESWEYLKSHEPFKSNEELAMRYKGRESDEYETVRAELGILLFMMEKRLS